MTVLELYNSVAQLGFEDSLEDESRFLFSANRALLQVSALRPATSACIINHKPLENKVRESTFEPVEKTEDLYFTAEGVKSYYFEADGDGMLYIERYSEPSGWEVIGTVSLSSKQRFKAYKGFIKEGGEFINAAVRLRFTGEYIYSVKNVAMYKYIYSASTEDVPAYEPFTRYDISTLTEDFLSLATPPIVESEGLSYLNQGYSVENGRVILLPYDAKGLYKVLYNHKPSPIVMSEEEDAATVRIDLDEDLCALLPILVASYVWVDDEPEKANYYLNLYRERAIDIERRIFNAAPVPMKNKNGW